MRLRRHERHLDLGHLLVGLEETLHRPLKLDGKVRGQQRLGFDRGNHVAFAEVAEKEGIERERSNDVRLAKP